MHASETAARHRGLTWNLPSTCVPVTEEAVYLTRDVAGEAFARTRCSHFSGFHMSSWEKHTKWQKLRNPTLTHAHVARCRCVLVDAGGLSVTHSLPPAEQAWLSLSFTTRLIDLLIIFFPGDPPVGDQRPRLYSFLLCSVLCWIDRDYGVKWPENKNLLLFYFVFFGSVYREDIHHDRTTLYWRRSHIILTGEKCSTSSFQIYIYMTPWRIHNP